MRSLLIGGFRALGRLGERISDVSGAAATILSPEPPSEDEKDAEMGEIAESVIVNAAQEAGLAVDEPLDDPAEAPDDPSLQAIGGERYPLSQILRDFEQFGMYDAATMRPIGGSIGCYLDSVVLVRPVRTLAELADAVMLIREAPAPLHFVLGAVYADRLILFTR